MERFKHQMLRYFESHRRDRSRSIFKFCSRRRNSRGGPEDRDSFTSSARTIPGASERGGRKGLPSSTSFALTSVPIHLKRSLNLLLLQKPNIPVCIPENALEVCYRIEVTFRCLLRCRRYSSIGGAGRKTAVGYLPLSRPEATGTEKGSSSITSVAEVF